MALSLRAILIFFLGLTATSLSHAQTLEEFYEAAKNQTAPVKEKMLGEEIAKYQKEKVVAGVLPKLSLQSTSIWREVANVGAFGQRYQSTSNFNLVQPLFRGGAEYYGIAAAKNLPKIAEYERENAENSLFAMVAEAFYQARRIEREREILLEQEKILRDRVGTLSNRVKIGRSKGTDLIAARSQLARITAERSRTERLWEEAKKLLMSRTGSTHIDKLIDSHKVDDLLVDPNWEKNLANTPQVKANELLYENAVKQAKVARGTYLPSMDLNGNYYLHRSGILRDSHWDVSLNAKWDLYTGGNDSAEVRIKKLEASQIEARLVDLKRNLTNDFAYLKKEFSIHQKALEELDDAVSLAKQNYEQHMKEANQGLVSDLDSLIVLESYLEVRRAYYQQAFDTKMAWVSLRVLAGDRP